MRAPVPADHPATSDEVFAAPAPDARTGPRPGEIHPRQAWQLLQAGEAVLVDVRTAEELSFVGRVPGAIHIPWACGLQMARNTAFIDQLSATVRPEDMLLFLCRSAKRSERAAEAAMRAGFLRAYNILEGFEGERDVQGQRGRADGWRFHGLPWLQD